MLAARALVVITTAATVPPPPPPPPSLAIDCAVRYLAFHFAATKLQNNPNQNNYDTAATEEDLHEQLQHVRDALRLYECRTSPPTTEKNTVASLFTDESPLAAVSKIRRRTLSKSVIGESRNHHNVAENIVKKNEIENKKSHTNTTRTTTSTLYVDPVLGRDDDDTSTRKSENTSLNQSTKKKRGSFEDPYRTIEAAVNTSRQQPQRHNQQPKGSRIIILRGGWYYLPHTLQLDARDTNLIIQAYPNEVPILSGGNLIVLNMTRTPTQNQSQNHSKQSTTNMYSAKLPLRSCPASFSPKSTTIPTPDGRSDENKNDDTSRDNCDGNYNFTTLFVRYPSRHPDNNRGSNTTRYTAVQKSCRRLVWAREPNGNSDYDLQPDGYATANGTIPGGRTWPKTTGSLHLSLKTPARNSTVYPWFGEDRDPRGNGNWYVHQLTD